MKGDVVAKTAHRKRLEESNKAKTAARAELLGELAAAEADADVVSSLKPNAQQTLASLGKSVTTAKSSG